MTEYEFYSQLQAVPVESFLSYFRSSHESAFRLELLNSYNVKEEAEVLKRFRSGAKKPPADFNQDWIELVKELKGTGLEMQRVRLIDEPLTDYLRFEIGWGYSFTIPAGENIRVIDRSTFEPLAERVPVAKDFWLFDDKRCVLLEYDFIGRFLGLKEVPVSGISPYLALKHGVLGGSSDILQSPYGGLIDYA